MTNEQTPSITHTPALSRAELGEQQRDAQLSARAWRKKHPNALVPELDTYLRDVEQFDDAVARDVAAAVFKEDRSAVPADVAPSAAQPASGQASSIQNGTKKASAQDESSQAAATGQPGAQGSSFSIEQAAEWVVSEWKKNPNLRLTWIRESLAKHGLMPEQADQAIAIARGKAEKQSAKPTSSAEQRSRGQTLEEETRQIAQQFVADLQKEGAKFLRDESGDVSVSLGGKLISLQETREIPNRDLDKLMSRIDCGTAVYPQDGAKAGLFRSRHRGAHQETASINFPIKTPRAKREETVSPFHDKTIVVTRCGRICLGNKKINFSQVFAGQAVGIKEVHDDIWLVSFMDYDLGYFDLETRVLEPLENPFGPNVLPM